MKITKRILTTDDDAIQNAKMILQNDGVIAFPTDTVYGIGVNFQRECAINQLFEIKGRDFKKPIAILLGNTVDFQKVAVNIPVSAYQLAEKFLPGALTLIVPKHPDLPKNISHYPTIGIRIPNHPFAIDLLNEVGPLAVTSANLSGFNDTQNGGEVMAQLDGRFDLLIDGGSTPGGIASTVVDLTKEVPVVLREGPISKKSILEHLSF